MTIIDARGMRCPWPALRAARMMRDEAAFVIRADDPRAGEELSALANAHGWAIAPAGIDGWEMRRGMEA